jgi:hypothetical protein
VEVMAEADGDAWWADYKRQLESRFAEESILIRALPCRML